MTTLTLDSPKLIIFSGKMGCGKDTAIDFLGRTIEYVRAECKESLHEATMALFGVPEDTYWEIYNDRQRKETPNSLFSIKPEKAKELEEYLGELTYKSELVDGMFPLTIREAMIFTSELVMKPMFGEDVFGKRRADKLRGNFVFVDGSFGFTDELHPAIDKIGQKNILGVRIYGRGDDKADSRIMLPDGLLENTVDIWNGEGVSLEQFEIAVRNAVYKFLFGGEDNE